jgi:hypothetical protein
MFLISQVLCNSNGEPIALILFDEVRNAWRIDTYSEHGFLTESDAVSFWLANFDTETGEFTGTTLKKAS